MNSANVDGSSVVKCARAWLGTPYVHQASAKGAGCDCLGLVRGVWRECVGLEPQSTPNYSPDWGEVGSREPILQVANQYFLPVELDSEQAGLLLLFRWNNKSIVKHMGISTSPDTFIHAYEKSGVVESPLNGIWHARLAYKFKFPDKV